MRQAKYLLLPLIVVMTGCLPQTSRDHAEAPQQAIIPATPLVVAYPVVMQEEVIDGPLMLCIPDSEPLIAMGPSADLGFAADITQHLENFDPSTDTITRTERPPKDIWERLLRGYDLDLTLHKRVEAELRWYASHPEYIKRVVKRASAYLYFVMDEIEKRDMPAEFALLPIVESAYQAFAYSHGRAAGIWQFIPSTGRMYDLKQNWWYDGRRDIVASTRAALDYLIKLRKYVDGDWMLALASYNSGAGTVLKSMKKNRRRGKPTDYWSLDLPKETEAYVPRLIAISILFKNPEEFEGIMIPSVPNKPYFAEIKTSSQMDLALAADLADISMDELYRLNPAFNRWATDPDGPHRLLVPIEKAEAFEQRLAQLPKKERLKWKRHRIRSGDSLLTIAKRYDTTVSLLKQVNELRSNSIRAGKHLIIPVAAKSLSTYSHSAGQRLQSIQNRRRSGHKLFYTVLPGDTLWEISQKHKVSVSKLAKWNGMAPKDPLHPGQRLVIWSKTKTASLSNTPAGTIRTIRYTVRRGDSLARISAKFNVRVADLKRWNKLTNGRYLQPGQKLRLRVDVTRQSDA